MKNIRKIIEIDKERCNGCGLCVIDCAEGALAIIDGKAEVISDMFCDGLGACIGACPQDALNIIERPAVPFDEDAAMEHVVNQKAKVSQLGKGQINKANTGCPGTQVSSATTASNSASGSGTLGCGCSGNMVQNTGISCISQVPQMDGASFTMHHHWPVKVRLVPASAPFLQGAHLLLAADCAGIATAQLHKEFAQDKIMLIACPKFEEREALLQKLCAFIEESKIASITTVRMEVPCCTGLATVVDEAIARTKSTVDCNHVVLNREGKAIAAVSNRLF